MRHLNGLAEQRCIHRLIIGRYLVERCQQFLFRHLSVAATSLQYLLQTRGIEHRLVLQRRKAVVENIVDDVKAVTVDGDAFGVLLKHYQLLLHRSRLVNILCKHTADTLHDV